MRAYKLIKEELSKVPTEYRHKEYNDAIWDAIKIIHRLEKEYKSNAWLEIYDKVLQLEKRYDAEQNTEAVNDCIKLQNLLNYFKQELCEDDNDGWIFCKQELPKITNSYLVTKKCESNGKSAYETAHEIFWTKDNKWDCERDEDYEWEVIAWRNKIAPCKEGGVE